MQRTPCLIAALALLLYGSSASAQGAAAPPATAPPAGQPSQEPAGTSDESIRQAVISALNADPHHFFRHVDVRVDNGVATLSGFVNSSQAINSARTITSKVPGVTRVVSGNLTLQPNRPR